ncbi:MAG TPA: hypothetical protein VGD78_12910 [Chthoniobacterales bacterium]
MNEPGPAHHTAVQPGGEPGLPWPTFVRAIRRLSHNVRNHLNTAGLEVSFAQEVTTDPEVGDSLAMLKQQLTKIRAELDHLLDRVVQPGLQVSEVRADELFEELQRDVQNYLSTAAPVTWELIAPGSMPVVADLDLTFRVVRELLDNALRHRSNEARPIQVRGVGSASYFALEIAEPKRDQPAIGQWGKEPFTGTDPTRYGLGLWSAERWLLAMEGRLVREYDADRRLLVTKVMLRTKVHP